MTPLPTKKLDVAYIITTHNKVTDAKAQMEIVRNIWTPHFNTIDIFHEYNGSEENYPQIYLETFLSRHTSLPHFIGAVDLINEGIMHVNKIDKKYDYIVVASADTWVYNPHKINKLFSLIVKKKYELLVTLWESPFFGTEFFIITPNLAKKIFPLEYYAFIHNSFINKFINDNKLLPLVEFYFTQKVFRATNIFRIGLIPYRRVIIPFFNRYSTKNFYSSHHNQTQRKQELKKPLSTFLGDKLSSSPILQNFINY